MVEAPQDAAKSAGFRQFPAGYVAIYRRTSENNSDPNEDTQMTRAAVPMMFAAVLMVGIVGTLPANYDLSTAADASFPEQEKAEKGDGGDDKKEEKSNQDKKQEAAQKADAPAESKADKSDKSDKSDKAEKAADAKEQKEAKAEEKPAAKEEKAQEKQAAKEAKAAKKRKTYKVEPKRIKVEVPLDGTFVARKMEEVVLRPESWSGYEIKEIVEHGAKVRRGQVLVKFDDERINEAIDDLELEQRLNELAILRSEEELPRQERTLALNLENAERGNRETKEDYQRYNEIDRPLIVKQYEYRVKQSQFQLDYEKEELEQLEKMYKSDDLTEATEEVILKRQKTYVDFAEFGLTAAKTNREEVMDILLPRLDIQIKQALETAEMALARAKMASTLDVNRARYELEQRKQSRTRSIQRHAKLLADRRLMEIKAPVDGTVYYGQCVDGRWSDMASLINRLKPHANVSSGTVMMTILDPRPLVVLANVDEAKRPEVSASQKVKITPPAEGSERIDAKVAKVSPIPTAANRFAVEFELEGDAIPDWIVAGMSCKTRITTYDKADALVVPKTAVRTDEDDEDKKYVWRVDPDDDEAKPERRDVTLGKTSGNNVEILKGLKKGDVISLDDESEKPKEE
jgi:multidrug resistance efflux pump